MPMKGSEVFGEIYFMLSFFVGMLKIFNENVISIDVYASCICLSPVILLGMHMIF